MLLNAMWDYENCEWGAPAANCKRPYGNSGYLVYYDINEALDFPFDAYDGDFDDHDKAAMDELHRGTVQALEVILQTRSFKPGMYVARDVTGYTKNQWEWFDSVAEETFDGSLNE